MKKECAIAVIPVRGGSVSIPRKNARILNGKPLLAYSIEHAKAAREIAAVYVSTDDAELAEIARRYGVEVLERPVHLAGPLTTLDEVMVHVAGQLDAAGVRFSHLVTIQATVPLLQPQTIDRAVRKCRSEGLDTVLTVVNAPHLAWSLDAEQRVVPLYQRRVNRQELPPYYRETGGVVVAAASVLATGTRFGSKVGVIEVEKAEALDIDDYFDWWLVEKSLSRRRVCLHVVGNLATGLGHVYRALTLADRLIDHDLFFLVNDESDLAADLIERRFYPCLRVTAGCEAEAIVAEAPDLVINDIIDTGEAYMSRLGSAGIATVNFEDVGPGSSMAGWLINAMYDEHPERADDRVFHGYRYDCLRDEFYSLPPGAVRDRVENVLVIFGGTDPSDLTLKCLQWLDAIPGSWRITVVLGIGIDAERSRAVQEFVAGARHEIETVIDTSIISRHMAAADIAVTSAGRTVFELASLGVPMAVMAQNERELHHSFARTSPGLVWLGAGEEVTRERFTDCIGQLLCSSILRREMHRCLLEADIRGGAQRVIDIIQQALATVKR